MQILESSPQQVVVSIPRPDASEVLLTFPLGGGEQDLAPLFSGPLWSAMIWERSVRTMCNFLEKNKNNIKSRKVVELGCGLGVPGLVAGISCEAEKVWLTDREDDLIPLRKAFAVNVAALGEYSGRIEPVDFDWSESVRADVQADVILAVECVSADVYGVESLDWLIAAILMVCRKDADVVLYLCSARRKNDGLDIVIDRLQKLSSVRDILKVDGYSDDTVRDVHLYQVTIRL